MIRLFGGINSSKIRRNLIFEYSSKIKPGGSDEIIEILSNYLNPNRGFLHCTLEPTYKTIAERF